MEKEQPIQKEIKEQAQQLGSLIDEYLNTDLTNKEWGFALLIFRFGDPSQSKKDHRSNYISNANREDMLATMKEFIARAEGRYHGI